MFLRSAARPEKSVDQACYVCYLNDAVLIDTKEPQSAFPIFTATQAAELGLLEACFIGYLEGTPCFSIILTEQRSFNGHKWVPLRDLYLDGDPELARLGGYARQIIDWDRNFRFCGRCSAPTTALPNEHARQCPRCQLTSYPRISPAIITAVIKGDQILLARGRQARDKKMFSLLAGFLEPGESLEDAVRREVREEAGIEVANVQYFKSQSWPFPDSLMVGFTAEHLSGEIRIDNNEIEEAGWFKADGLPSVPVRRSISSELIQWFVAAQRK